MIKYKIEDKTFTLKNKWEELTMEDWINIQKIEKLKGLYMEELWTIKLFETLTDATEADLMYLEIDQLNKLVTNMKFLQEPQPQRKNKKMKIDGVEYMFRGDLNKMNLGENVSIKTFQENVKDEFESMMLQMAVLVRPVVKDEMGGEKVERFDGATVEERSKKLLKGKYIDLYNYLVFFFTGKTNSTTSGIKNSSKEHLPHLHLK